MGQMRPTDIKAGFGEDRKSGAGSVMLWDNDPKTAE